MELWEVIKKYVIKYRSQLILGLALIATLICLAISCSNNASLNKQYKHNVDALTDSIEYYQTRSGQLVAEKTLLEGDLKLLKSANEELYKKVKELEIKKPEQIVYVETEVVNEVHDTTYLVDPTLPYQRKDFAFNNEWRKLEGFMELKDNLLGLNITTDKVFVDYTLALKDGQVFLNSSNPYVQYNQIQGFTVPKSKKPRWGFGVGPQVGVGYDIFNKTPGIYVGVGFSFNYNFITF